jgi:mono/diheme cytochrome c family protein
MPPRGRLLRKRTRVSSSILIATALAFVAITRIANAADANETETGRVLYMRYCASCHGPNADGHGPVAKVLATPPADLRTLGKRYGIPLNRMKVAAFIDGRAAVAAHGDRDMPVWGDRFNDIPAEGAARELAVKDRIDKIIAYLNSIQNPPAK